MYSDGRGLRCASRWATVKRSQKNLGRVHYRSGTRKRREKRVRWPFTRKHKLYESPKESELRASSIRPR